MRHVFATFILAIFASKSNAMECPERNRFVDFGQKDLQGKLHKGGPIFRAFDADGTPLLLSEQTDCLEVDLLAKDGRALDIPVVSQVEVDMTVAKLDLLHLRLNASDDTQIDALENVRVHQERLVLPKAIKAQGADFVCMHAKGSVEISCQFAPPYKPNAPLVIYCDNETCNMPVLARSETLNVSAAWAQEQTDMEALGANISSKLQTIVRFLAPHT